MVQIIMIWWLPIPPGQRPPPKRFGTTLVRTGCCGPIVSR
jgi:hypothetical protein